MRADYPRYTNGWFQVAWSDELKPGTLLRRKYFGNDMVLFRGEDGVARAVGAYCPHLGADLSVGGVVRQNCIRCPFHGWEFTGDGQCARIPYAQKIPPRARLDSWSLVERHGLIFMWRDASRAAPTRELPTIEEFSPAEWTAFIPAEMTIRCHSLDILENSVDSAHFVECHPFDAAHVELVRSDDVLEIKQNITVKLLGKDITSTAHYHMLEPGFHYVWLDFPASKTLLFCSITPVDEEKVSFRMSFAFKRRWPRILDPMMRLALEKSIVAQMVTPVKRDDVPIWENKLSRPTGALCEADGPFAVVRRWYVGMAS